MEIEHVPFGGGLEVLLCMTTTTTTRMMFISRTSTTSMSTSLVVQRYCHINIRPLQLLSLSVFGLLLNIGEFVFGCRCWDTRNTDPTV